MALGALIVARTGKPPRIAYRWDPETDILTGSVRGRPHEPKEGGLTGSVELEGADGSFILLDVAGGEIRGVEVVVWPDVRTVASLQLPRWRTRTRRALPRSEARTVCGSRLGRWIVSTRSLRQMCGSGVCVTGACVAVTVRRDTDAPPRESAASCARLVPPRARGVTPPPGYATQVR